MRRFSSRVVSSTRSTCSADVFPTSVTTGVCASTRARMLGSSSQRFAWWRVLPKAAIRAVRSSSERARSKNSASFGLEPGQPPSM
jgi:hypothetical protein